AAVRGVAVARGVRDRASDRHTGRHPHPLPRPSLSRSTSGAQAKDYVYIKDHRPERQTVMRKIINSTYISLDGVVEQPHEWPTIERPSDERAGQFQTDLLMACDAVLMGRRTYEGFAPVWQTRSGDPASDRMNAMPKYVVSTTLKDPEWANTTVIATDVPEATSKLKAEAGQDIVQYGFGAV